MFNSFIPCCAICSPTSLQQRNGPNSFIKKKKTTVNIYNWGNRISYDCPSAIETTLQNISKQSYQPVKMMNISIQKRYAHFINITGDAVTLGTWKIRFNTAKTAFPARGSHYKDKTVLRPAYLYDGTLLKVYDDCEIILSSYHFVFIFL